MAARRFAGSKVNWTQLTSKLTEADKPHFSLFKTKHDGYLRKMSAIPETPPAIDWASYKAKIPIAGLVDQFQKQYEALTIPYPADNETAKVTELEKKVMADAHKYIEESKVRIQSYEKEIEEEKSLIPVAEMTLQEYALAYPDEALNTEKRPSFWPHRPEDQITPEDEEWWEKRKSGQIQPDH